MRKTNEPCPRCRERGQDSRGDNLVCFHNGTKHCFSCGYHEAPAWEGPSKALNRAEERLNGAEGILPSDFTREVPPEGWKWLLQWGLPYSYWKENCGYSPKESRLYFLIPSREHLAFSQGRYLGVHPPLGGLAPAKWRSMGNSHKSACSVGQGESTVLVEDWISCNKVGQITESLCLFGVAIHPAHIYFLNDGTKRPIVLWLDKDQEGRSSKKAARLHMLTGRPVNLVVTEKDPKALSINSIKEVLNV